MCFNYAILNVSLSNIYTAGTLSKSQSQHCHIKEELKSQRVKSQRLACYRLKVSKACYKVKLSKVKGFKGC